jgi:hypothetical protein
LSLSIRTGKKFREQFDGWIRVKKEEIILTGRLQEFEKEGTGLIKVTS